MNKKFKTGDRVTWGGQVSSFVIKEIVGGTVYFEPDSGEYINKKHALHEEDRPYLSSTNLVALKYDGIVLRHTSPIETTTVVTRKIVPGIYGKVRIEDGPRFYLMEERIDSHSLREAANLFNEIADFIEGK